jgi:hypothetical protein
MFDLARRDLLKLGIYVAVAVSTVVAHRTGPLNLVLSAVSVGIGTLVGVTTIAYVNSFDESYRETNARTAALIGIGGVAFVAGFGSFLYLSDAATRAFMHGVVTFGVVAQLTELALPDSYEIPGLLTLISHE